MDDDAGTLPPKQDFSGWYNDILWRAEIMDVRYPVKGLYVWYPYGFAIRKFVYSRLRELLDRDHQETLFPLLIPEQEFMKEAEHIKGFEDEVYWVTHGGTTPLDVKLALRPTSETAIYPMYALWLRSHADLPMKYYQIVNTFRYETKQTRPLIRLREITSFMESHTVHATWDEAEAQCEYELGLTKEFYDGLCIPITISKRPDWDKFPGADYTIAVDAIMPGGKTLQIGTVHHLGTHFSKTFAIQYEDKNGGQQLANQTCYGISERCIAALLSMHGDDKGLILPPAIAPVQAVIVPITIGKRHDDVLAAAQKLEADLKAAGFRVKMDTRDMRPGAKYYWWELRGVPLRLELGPRDLDGGKVMAVKRTGEKCSINLITKNETIEINKNGKLEINNQKIDSDYGSNSKINEDKERHERNQNIFKNSQNPLLEGDKAKIEDGKLIIEKESLEDGVTRVLAEITKAIQAKAEEHTKSHLCSVDSMDALNAALNEGKVAVVHWCRERGCGDAIEDKANSSILGTEVRSPYVSSTDGPCIVCGKPGKATLVGRTY